MGEASKYVALSTQTSWTQLLVPWVGIFYGVEPFPTAKSAVDAPAQIENHATSTVVTSGVERIIFYDWYDRQSEG